ncbi:MAG: signal peptidase II [Caldilineae bacterium]|nr:MAG: signal peptidase II [Caldilineae bacterium]
MSPNPLLPRPGPLRGLLPYLGLGLLFFLADRLSKAWAATYLAERGNTSLSTWLHITEAHNTGIGLGLWQGTGFWVGWLTVAIIGGLAIWLYRVDPQHRLLRLGLAMMMGGAAGNMVDRLRDGVVLDFIQVSFWPRVFNVADVAIRLGAVLVVAGVVWGERRLRARKEEHALAVPQTGSE